LKGTGFEDVIELDASALDAQVNKDRRLRGLKERLATPYAVDEHVVPVLSDFNTIPGLVTIFSCQGHWKSADVDQEDQPKIVCLVADELWNVYRSEWSLLMTDPSVSRIVFSQELTSSSDQDHQEIEALSRMTIWLHKEYSGPRCTSSFKRIAKVLKGLYQDKCTTVPIPVMPPKEVP
jgi:hypothetical protein